MEKFENEQTGQNEKKRCLQILNSAQETSLCLKKHITNI